MSNRIHAGVDLDPIEVIALVVYNNTLPFPTCVTIVVMQKLFVVEFVSSFTLSVVCFLFLGALTALFHVFTAVCLMSFLQTIKAAFGVS